MQLLSTDSFFDWAKQSGIVLDSRYSPPQCLVYESLSDNHRWWNTPTDPAELRAFIERFLDGMEFWISCYIWRRGGSWPPADPPRSRLDAIRKVLARGPDIPADYQGAVHFDADEREGLLGLAVPHVLSGWSVNDDLFIIPEHARYILQTDHHGVIHATCYDRAAMDRLIEHMDEGGYSLPTTTLDWTFKRPDWMGPHS